MKYYSLLTLGISLLMAHSIHASLAPIDTRFRPEFTDLTPKLDDTTLIFNPICNSDRINLSFPVGYTQETPTEGATVSDLLEKHGNILWFCAPLGFYYREISRCAFYYNPNLPLSCIKVANIQTVEYDQETYKPLRFVVESYNAYDSNILLNEIICLQKAHTGLEEFLKTFQTQTSKDLLSEIVQSQSKKQLQQGQQKITELFGNLPKLTQNQSQSESITSHLYDTPNALTTQKVSSENIHENANTSEIPQTEISPLIHAENTSNGQESEFIFGDFSNQTTEEKPQKEERKQTIPTKKEKKQKEKERLAAIKAQEEEKKEKQRLQDQLQQLRKNIANQAAKKGKELLEKKELEAREQAKRAKVQAHSNPDISVDKPAPTSKKPAKRNYLKELEEIESALRKYEDDINPNKTIDETCVTKIISGYAEYKGLASDRLADVIIQLKKYTNIKLSENQNKFVMKREQEKAKKQQLNNSIQPHVANNTPRVLQENHNMSQASSAQIPTVANSTAANSNAAAVAKALELATVLKKTREEPKERTKAKRMLQLLKAEDFDKNKIEKFIKHVKGNPKAYVLHRETAESMQILYKQGHTSWPSDVLVACHPFPAYNFLYSENDILKFKTLTLNMKQDACASKIQTAYDNLGKSNLSHNEIRQMQQFLNEFNNFSCEKIFLDYFNSDKSFNYNCNILLRKIKPLGFYSAKFLMSSKEDYIDHVRKHIIPSLLKQKFDAKDVDNFLYIFYESNRSNIVEEICNSLLVPLYRKTINSLQTDETIKLKILDAFNYQNIEHIRSIDRLYALVPESFSHDRIEQLKKLKENGASKYTEAIDKSTFNYKINNIIFNILAREYIQAEQTEAKRELSQEEKELSTNAVQAKLSTVLTFQRDNSLLMYVPLKDVTHSEFLTMLIAPHNTNFYADRLYATQFKESYADNAPLHNFQSFIKLLPERKILLERFITTSLVNEPGYTSDNEEIQKLEKLCNKLHLSYCISLYQKVFGSNDYQDTLTEIKDELAKMKINWARINFTDVTAIVEQISNITLALIYDNRYVEIPNDTIESIIQSSQSHRQRS